MFNKTVYLIEVKDKDYSGWNLCQFKRQYDYRYKPAAVRFRNELQKSFPEFNYRVVEFERVL